MSLNEPPRLLYDGNWIAANDTPGSLGLPGLQRISKVVAVSTDRESLHVPSSIFLKGCHVRSIRFG